MRSMRDLAAMGFDEMSLEVGGGGGPPPPRLSARRATPDRSRDTEARDVLRAMASRTLPVMPSVVMARGLSQRGADPLADYEALLTLDDNNVSRAAAPSDRARHMRRIRPKGPKEMCLVCHDEYGTGGRAVVALPCGHDYHEDCINKWFDREKTCPVCRKELGQR